MTVGSLPDGLFAVPPGKLACVVTSLQMMAPPPNPAGPAPPGVTLRRVRHPDPAWYKALFRGVGADWLWSSRLALSDGDLKIIIGDDDVEVHAVGHDGIDVGLVEIDFRTNPSCELAFLGLVPRLTGKGIGPWLMGKAIARAWARPIERFWVHTCTLDHPAALRFYSRSGFEPFRVQVEVMDDPRLSGLLPGEAAPFVPRL